MSKALFILAIIIFSNSFSFLANAQDEPSIENISKWTQAATEQIMTFNFNDYDKKVIENKKYFTIDGYTKFYDAMEKSGGPDMIKQGKMVREIKLTCFPETSQTQNDPPIWVAKFPMQTTIYNASRQGKYYDYATVFIEMENGQLGIKQWISRAIDASQAEVCTEKQRIMLEIENLKNEISENQLKIKTLEEKIQ